MTEARDYIQVWRLTYVQWGLIGAAVILMAITFYDGIEWMASIWSTKEEYGYGYLIPVISAFFIWSRKDRLEQIEFSGSWAAVLFVLVGLAVFVLGELSTIYVVIEYAFIFVLASLVLSFTGWRGFREVWVPLLLLVFMIPLPQFIYQNLSGQLQLVSSEIGVAFIRMFGISVYLEGNVIDLGNYRLQVVEACSGLRYLFPLVSLAFIAAYIYKAAFWKRAVIFISSVPITILMNSLRIGIIGILVENWGVSQAEGFLHYFEGWVIFMACMTILLLEMWALARVGSDSRSLGEIFAIDFPEPTPKDATVSYRRTSVSFVVALALLLAASVYSSTLTERTEVSPDHESFAEFPLVVGTWKGKRNSLESIYIDALKFDDYLLADYNDDKGNSVNFYVAYYASQRKGESAHSPRTCIPGGGWKITSLEQKALPVAHGDEAALVVNRVLIKKEDYKQLVYYWFQQRGRVITNEYMVKWFLFWDALTRNRTDGALVRLTAFIGPNESEAAADRLLTDFAVQMMPYMPEYIPE